MVATEMLTELTFNNLSLAEQADFENCDLDTEFAPELVEYLLDKLRPASPATLSAPLLKQLVASGVPHSEIKLRYGLSYGRIQEMLRT